MKDLKEVINDIKPSTARNHKFLTKFIDVVQERINQNHNKGKEYVCFPVTIQRLPLRLKY